MTSTGRHAARVPLKAKEGAATRRAAFLVLALAATIALSPTARGQKKNTWAAETEAAFEGQKCPPLTLMTNRGAHVEVLGPRTTGVTLITFLISSCIPCRTEAPVLDRYYRTYGKRGLHVIGIDVQEPLGVMQELIRKLNVSYPIYADSGAVASQLRAYAYPTTILVDENGKIILYRVGTYSDITRYLDERFSRP